MKTKNTYHRDGTVTYWDVYRQAWQRKAADAIPAKILTTFNDRERTRVAKMV